MPRDIKMSRRALWVSKKGHRAENLVVDVVSLALQKKESAVAC